MAKPNRGVTLMDNRAKMITIGAPEPVSVPDIEAMEASAYVADSEASPPQMPESEGPVAAPVSGESAPTSNPPTSPAATPTPTPAPQPTSVPAPEAGQPPVAVEEDPFVSKWTKMNEDERREMARHQASMIGRQSEEIGYSRKILDLIAQGKFPVAPNAPQTSAAPDPTEKFMAPKLDDAAKQELIALSLTDPERHEEILFKRFRARLDGETAQNKQREQQQKLIETFQKVQDIVTSPDFQQWERTLPTHVIEAAKHSPDTLNWVVSQFQASRPGAAAAHAGPQPSRVVKLGTAAGAPTSGVQEKNATGLTRTKILKMMAEDPQQYAVRQQEISQLIAEGKIPGYD